MYSLEQEINERLVRLYGNEPLTGKPKYRVVRSEFQTEKRFGSYDVVTQAAGLYIGTKTGLVEIKKYWYMKDCWLLERVEVNTNRQDTIHEPYTYEPILPFLDKSDNVLPLNWKAIEFVCNRLEHAEREVKNEEDHRLEEEKKQLEESEKVFGLLDAPEPTKPLPTFETSTLIPKG